jgi:hypothetical protein
VPVRARLALNPAWNEARKNRSSVNGIFHTYVHTSPIEFALSGTVRDKDFSIFNAIVVISIYTDW